MTALMLQTTRNFMLQATRSFMLNTAALHHPGVVSFTELVRCPVRPAIDKIGHGSNIISGPDHRFPCSTCALFSVMLR